MGTKRIGVKVRVKGYAKSEAQIGTRYLGSTLLRLECGHVKRQKGSVKIPKTVYCKECAIAEENAK